MPTFLPVAGAEGWLKIDTMMRGLRFPEKEGMVNVNAKILDARSPPSNPPNHEMNIALRFDEVQPRM